MKRPAAVNIVAIAFGVSAIAAATLAIFLNSTFVSQAVQEAEDVADAVSGLRIASVIFVGVALWLSGVAVLLWKRFRIGWALAMMTALCGIVIALDDVMIFDLFSEDGMLVFIPAALAVLLLVPSVLRWFFRRHRTAVETTAVPQH